MADFDDHETVGRPTEDGGRPTLPRRPSGGVSTPKGAALRAEALMRRGDKLGGHMLHDREMTPLGKAAQTHSVARRGRMHRVTTSTVAFNHTLKMSAERARVRTAANQARGRSEPPATVRDDGSGRRDAPDPRVSMQRRQVSAPPGQLAPVAAKAQQHHAASQAQLALAKRDSDFSNDGTRSVSCDL